MGALYTIDIVQKGKILLLKASMTMFMRITRMVSLLLPTIRTWFSPIFTHSSYLYGTIGHLSKQCPSYTKSSFRKSSPRPSHLKTYVETNVVHLCIYNLGALCIIDIVLKYKFLLPKGHMTMFMRISSMLSLEQLNKKILEKVLECLIHLMLMWTIYYNLIPLPL